MNKNVIFFHLPKCGGQALLRALGEVHDGHFSVRDERWLMEVKRRRADFKVVWFRHPYERLVSLHAWLAALEKDPRRCHNKSTMRAFGVMAASLSADEFWRVLRWDLVDRITPFFRPVSWFLGAEKFDFVGRIESMDEDVERLSKELGVRMAVPRFNASEHGGWREEFSELTLKRLEKRYGNDFALMNYEKEI